MASYADLIKKAQKDWDCEDLMSSAVNRDIGRIPFSSPLVNWACYGGIPRGRMIEFFGEPGSGKSTSALDVCKNAVEAFHDEFNKIQSDLQEKISSGDKNASSKLDELMDRGPKKVLYIDVEHGFDIKWARKIGLDRTEIDVMQPPNIPGEEILQKVLEFIETGEIGLVVIDSVPALTPAKLLDKKLGEATVAALAGLMTTFCTKVISMLTRYDCTLILINQVRENLNNPYVVRTPGGKAIEFYSSLRMCFRRGKPVDFLGNELPMSSENPAGYIIDVQLVKQKTASFDRKKSTYYLMCDRGIVPELDFAILAVNKYGIVRKSGAWFVVNDPYTLEPLEDDGKPVKVHGMAKVYDYFNENPEYYNRLKEYILNDINGVELTDAGEVNESL